MNLYDVLNDQSIKSKAKRKKIVDAIIGGDLTLDGIDKLIGSLNDEQMTIVLQAIEEITKKGLKKLDADYLQLAEKYIASGSAKVKEEASKIVGNLAKDYPDQLDSAVKALIRNINDASTDVRAGSAYGLSKIVELGKYASSNLYNIVGKIGDEETDTMIKKQYKKALKKASKKRK